MHPSWAQALRPMAANIRRLGNLLNQDGNFLPPGPQVLRAFSRDICEVRILIVGQDPYPSPGHANGLSFSVNPDVSPIPKSLVNIFTELRSDLGLPEPSSGDLSPWFERGVMLLNRSLTVRPGTPASHRGKGWEEITMLAIEALAVRHEDHGQPLVAVLWGRQARELQPRLAQSKVPVIASAHPSPLSAYGGFFGSKPFSRANQLLIAQGSQPLNWQLP